MFIYKIDIKFALLYKENVLKTNCSLIIINNHNKFIFDSDSNLLPLSKNLDSYLMETRLFISTYNATTFLESFKSNIPTVIYWDSKFWEINDSSKPYFNLLRDANIFFDSPKTAALHVNEIWEDVQGWWNSKKVKEAVKIFSETYAYTGSAPLEELRSAILNWD